VLASASREGGLACSCRRRIRRSRAPAFGQRDQVHDRPLLAVCCRFLNGCSRPEADVRKFKSRHPDQIQLLTLYHRACVSVLEGWPPDSASANVCELEIERRREAQIDDISHALKVREATTPSALQVGCRSVGLCSSLALSIYFAYEIEAGRQ
jgi:hypothetical protein